MYPTQTFSVLVSLAALVCCKEAPSSAPPGLRYSISNHTVPLIPLRKEYEASSLFAAEVFVGSRVFRLAVDTGSSDTWVLATDVNCTDRTTLQPLTPAECGFAGPGYDPDSPSFDVIPDMHLNGSYANGIVVNGPLGHTELILGGLTLPKQIISAVTYTSAGGVPVGNLSGILGLAYPSLTSAFPGDDPSKDIRCRDNSSCGPVPYRPIIKTLFNETSIDPIFSCALSRSSSFGGVMTFGGVPKLDETYVNVSEAIIASSPIIPIGNGTVPNYYTANVKGLVYSNAKPSTGQGRYILDTGTISNVLVKEDADSINALFMPPAVYNDGLYVVACNASAPELGVNIGGQLFYHNPKDMILEYDGQCISAVQTSATAKIAPILGASWLKNVLAVFDVGASEVTFVSRPYYEDS